MAALAEYFVLPEADVDAANDGIMKYPRISTADTVRRHWRCRVVETQRAKRPNSRRAVSMRRTTVPGVTAVRDRRCQRGAHVARAYSGARAEIRRISAAFKLPDCASALRCHTRSPLVSNVPPVSTARVDGQAEIPSAIAPLLPLDVRLITPDRPLRMLDWINLDP